MEVFPELTPPPSQLLFTHFKPITIGAQAVGLLIPRRSLSGWILLSIVAAFFIGGSLFWIVQLHHLLSDHISLLERIVETIQLICGLFLMVICYQNSFRVHQTFSVVLRNLNEMDVQLSSTKVHVNQSRKVIRVCSQISIHCASVLGLLISHILSNHDVTRLSFFYYLIRFVPIFSIGILVLLFVNVTDEVRVRLTALNDTLSEYFANQNQIPERYFRIVSLVYELAFEICFKWNSTFGLCNLIQIGFCVISITAKIFFIFITLNNLALAKLYDFLAFPWLILLLVPVVSLALHCQSMKDEVKRLNGILFEVQSSNSDVAKKRFHLIDVILGQIKQQEIRFCTDGFFDIDMNLIFLITGAVTTYLVILLQFNINTGSGGGQGRTTHLNETLTE